MSPLRVTVDDLRGMGACETDVAKFCALFGEQVDITVETVTAAFAAQIDVEWWARKVFGAEYERVRAAAWAEYGRVTAPALAEYERVRAAAWAEYERVTAPALAEYERVRAPAIVALADARAGEVAL